MLPRWGDPVYSSKTGRRYCPVSQDVKCRAERRRLVKAGIIDLDADRADVAAAMRRKG